MDIASKAISSSTPGEKSEDTAIVPESLVILKRRLASDLRRACDSYGENLVQEVDCIQREEDRPETQSLISSIWKLDAVAVSTSGDVVTPYGMLPQAGTRRA